jgi:hypothetical protein
VPGLGNLPIAGVLFRNQRDTTRREEVIILLTPHIVKDDDAYAKLSEEQLKDAEQLRVGVRKGMMFWGRERLANLHYEIATDALRKARPDRKKAIWHLNAATNLNPKFMEAIKLKQELTGKEITTSDASTVRTFVRRAIMEDTAPTTQPVVELVWREETPATQPAASEPALQVAAIPATQPSAPKLLGPEHTPAIEEITSAEQPVAATPQATAEVENIVVEVSDTPSTQPSVIVLESTETQPEATSTAQTEPAQGQQDQAITEMPVEVLPGK